jgi:hypothetical protein
MCNPGETQWDDVAYSEFCLDAAGAGGPFTEKGVVQRMVRRGPWKLNYYHGQPSQLFNLDEDPDELADRIADPSCRDVAARLTSEVLDGWDPDTVSARMAELRAQQTLLTGWAGNVKPPDTYRWSLRPEMDFLDAEQID